MSARCIAALPGWTARPACPTRLRSGACGTCWRSTNGPQVMAGINHGLARQGLMLKAGTVVDATIIAAPSSTENQQGERDPEMHQTKMGDQWHFGMKAHVGVDAESGLVHTVILAHVAMV